MVIVIERCFMLMFTAVVVTTILAVAHLMTLF